MQMNRLLAPLPPTPIPTSLLVPKLRQLLLTSSVRQHRQPNQTARGGKKAWQQEATCTHLLAEETKAELAWLPALSPDLFSGILPMEQDHPGCLLLS